MITLEQIDRLKEDELLLALQHCNNYLVNFYLDREFLIEYSAAILNLLKSDEKEAFIYSKPKRNERRRRAKRRTALIEIYQDYMMNVLISLDRRFSSCAPAEIKLELYNILQHIFIAKSKKNKAFVREKRKISKRSLFKKDAHC